MDIRGTEAVRAIHDKIEVSLSRPMQCRDHSISVGASIGIAIYPDDSSDLEGLLRSVDGSMYREKTGGPHDQLS